MGVFLKIFYPLCDKNLENQRRSVVKKNGTESQFGQFDVSVLAVHEVAGEGLETEEELRKKILAGAV